MSEAKIYVQDVENDLTAMRDKPKRGDVLILMTGRIRYCVMRVAKKVESVRIQTHREPNKDGNMETVETVDLPMCVWRDLFLGGVTPGTFDVEALDALFGAPPSPARDTWNAAS